jgi:hypothetical protein
MTTDGAGFLETTSVVFIVTDPVLSLAVIWIMGAVLASLSGGRPDKVLVDPSRDSQLGALDSL